MRSGVGIRHPSSSWLAHVCLLNCPDLTVARFDAFIDAHPDCFHRSCRVGHIAGSAWLVDTTAACRPRVPGGIEARRTHRIWLVDVRAGAEALAREQTATARETGTVISTPLLVPTTVPGEGVETSRMQKLERCGLVLREGIDGQLRVLEIPVALKGADPARWIGSVVGSELAIEDALASATGLHAVASPELVRRILASPAAREAAVRTLTKKSLRKAAD